jgi:subtilisin family serine protease
MTPFKKGIFSFIALTIMLSIGTLQPTLAEPAAQGDATPPASRQQSSSPEQRFQFANSPAALLRKAQSNGNVRVIVQLNTRFQPEGQLAAAQAQAQRSAIAQARQTLTQALGQYQAKVLGQSNQWSIPFAAYEVNAAGLQYLQSSAQVVSIQEDRLRFKTNNTLSLNKMGVPPAWTSGYDGSGYTVAILDDGVQGSHTFLGGRVVAEACYSTYDVTTNLPTYKLYSLCPGGITSTSQTGAGASDPAACIALANANGLDEQCDHGTHVAGIAAGNDGDNGSINDGVARAANIIGIQVFTYLDCQTQACTDNDGEGLGAFDSNIIDGLNQVYSLRNTYQIASVNMSLGGGKYTSQQACDDDNVAMKNIIGQLRSVNIATIIASGNEFYGDGISAPGCISNAVAVGSVSDVGEWGGIAGKISSFTNTSSMLDLLASGWQINSSVTVPTDIGFGLKSGTSMATPQVTGAWAVIRQAVPAARVSEILQALQDTGTKVKDDIRADGFHCGNGFQPCSNLTFSLINVNAAIKVLKPTAAPTVLQPANGAFVTLQPKFSWGAPTGAIGYTMEVAFDPGFTSIVPGYPITGIYTSHTPPLGTFQAGQVYYWHVCAMNKYGLCSAYSPTYSFLVDTAPERNYYGAPPTLTWTAVSWASSYLVEVSQDPTLKTGVRSKTVPANSQALDTATLAPALTNGRWYWHVVPIKSDGTKGTPSVTDSFTLHP